MDSNLPLLMLVLASALVVLLIVYGIRYKSAQRKRFYHYSRQMQEPQLGSTNLSEDGADKKERETNLDLDGIIGEVKVRHLEHPPEIKKMSRPLAAGAKPAAKSPLIVLHIMAAENQSFMGYELLQSLLSAGLRFGEMNIFHRYEQPTGQGKILFSLASATEPGTFNLDEVGSLTCVGLSLFMDTRKLTDSAQVFNLMLDTARLLAEDLGGKVYDEQHQELTAERIACYQQQALA